MTDRMRSLQINDENRRWWALGAMCFALFMIMLDNTVVNVALPSIQRSLHASTASLEWTVNAYTLSFAVLLVTGGRLGDLFGRRKLFLAGVIIFAGSSGAIGFSPSDTWLVAWRAVQGCGAALMMPATLSIITNAFPAAERGKAIGTWAGVSALALAIGPVLGGFLVENVSWQSIFFLNLPVAVAAVLVTLFAVRESRDETVARTVDVPGVATLTIGLGSLVLALVEGNTWHWGSAREIALFAIAIVGLGGFGVIETRRRVPMVDFSFFRSRTFLGANIVAFIVSFAMLAMFFFLALYMQDIRGYSPLQAGVRFLPSTLMIVLIAPLAGRLADRVGSRPLMTFGLLCVSGSLFWQSHLTVTSAYSALLPGFVLIPHEHRRDELRRADQGGRRLGDPVDEQDGRRDLRRRRPRRARGDARAQQARRTAPRSARLDTGADRELARLGRRLAGRGAGADRRRRAPVLRLCPAERPAPRLGRRARRRADRLRARRPRPGRHERRAGAAGRAVRAGRRDDRAGGRAGADPGLKRWPATRVRRCGRS
jgi:EmrB/QacA subfamily drug resistance transporter